MSYINDTLWNNLQFSDATNEKRFSELGIINAVKESTQFVDYIPPSAREALSKISSLRLAEIPVIKDQSVTVVQTPGFDFIPANLEETAKYSFIAYDVFSGFRHYPSTYANNMVDEKFAVEQKMKNIAHAMGDTIESILAARLEERKTQKLAFTTQVNQSSGSGTYTFDESVDILKINKAAQQETMFASLDELMRANKLPGNYRTVVSPAGLAVQKQEALKFGAGNTKNIQAIGFMSADRIHNSHNISADSDVFNGWFLRDGSVGVYENFPWDFVNGTEIAGKKWSISDMEIPFTRLRANIYTNKEATNADALITSGSDSNTIMSHFEEMAVWIRFYFVYRYNSDLSTRPNDVVKIKGLTS